MNLLEQLRIDEVGEFLLNFVLDHPIGFKQILVVHAATLAKRLKCSKDAGLPIDQRAVTVEAEGAEIGQFHLRRRTDHGCLAQEEGRPEGARRPSSWGRLFSGWRRRGSSRNRG